MHRIAKFRTLTRMTARDVAALREEVFEEGVASEAEARALVRLAASVPEGDPAWRDFYCEALSDWARREDGAVSARRAGVLADEAARTAPSGALNLALMSALTARQASAAPAGTARRAPG